MATYKQARADFEFLESIFELEDEVELDAMRVDLMRNPTKAIAAHMYETAIRLWFDERRRHGSRTVPHSAAARATRICQTYC